MIKLIIRANKSYDNMKEPNRTFFFILVLLPLIIGSQFLLTTIFGDKGFIYWALWILILTIFRMIPIFIDIKNKNVN
jgi:hypothetical protein